MRIFYLCEFQLANISHCFKIYSLLLKCYRLLFIFLILYQCRASVDHKKNKHYETLRTENTENTPGKMDQR